MVSATFLPVTLRQGAARFWTWWTGELRAFLPAKLRGGRTSTSQRLVVDFSDGEVRFLRSRGGALERLGSVTLGKGSRPDIHQIQSIHKIVRKARLGGSDALVRLPRDKVLRRVVDLPAAAAENLREVLGFEMDRQTPFKVDEVRFDFRIREHDPQRKRIKVDLVVVPREAVAHVMRQAETWGVDLDLVDMGEETVQEDQLFDLLPRVARDARIRIRRRLNLAAVFLCAVMLGVAVYLPLEAKWAELAVLEAELERVRAAAGKVDEMHKQFEALTTRSRFVIDLKVKRWTANELLNEVTRLLPDNTWVLKFGIRGDELSVSGFSAKPTALIGLLEASPMFAGARFISPVTMDQKIGMERFNLTAKIEGRNG